MINEEKIQESFRESKQETETDTTPELYAEQRTQEINNEINIYQGPKNLTEESDKINEIQQNYQHYIEEAGAEDNQETLQLFQNKMQEEVDFCKNEYSKFNDLEKLEEISKILKPADFKLFEKILGNKEGNTENLFDPKGKVIHASKVTRLTRDDQDWIGIHSTRLNAHLIKTIFRQYAHPRINKNPRTKADLNKHFAKGENIMVTAGWRPGWSTDYVATILAERLHAKTVINLSNIKYVYDRDPKKFKTAKKIKKINWADFRKIVGNKWDPGLNMPFDPVASKHAQELGLKVIITAGKNIPNLKNILNNQRFFGTIIYG